MTPYGQSSIAAARAAFAAASPTPKPRMLQEMFTLDAGPVTLTVPVTLSPESYQDMADRIEIFLRAWA
jgi:hypothetical protein